MERTLKKILVVGGTGFVGGYTALYLQTQGYDVTVMSRSNPKGSSKLNALPYRQGNYVEDSFSNGELEGFDALVFCAGTDLGCYPEDGPETQAEFFQRCNTEGIPEFFARARDAGMSRAVYMGSFYSFVAPDSIEAIPYVRSRHLADEGARALSSPSFNVCSCALPWIVGYLEGFPVAHWTAFAKYATGELAGDDVFAPPGGANFMTCRSVAEAMLGGLLRGESGKSYLIGDVNLTWKAFFGLWFQAAGRSRDLPVREDAEHPIIPREVIAYLGGGGTDYEPPAAETELLGYRRGVLPGEVEECFRYYSQL